MLNNWEKDVRWKNWMEVGILTLDQWIDKDFLTYFILRDRSSIKCNLLAIFIAM